MRWETSHRRPAPRASRYASAVPGDRPLIRRIEAWLSRRSPIQVAAIGLLLMGFVGLLDYLNGYEVSFSIFYLAPVAVVAWHAGPGLGYVFCVAGAATWFAVDEASGHPYSHWLIPVWNATVRLGFFAVTTWLLGELKRRLAAETALARIDGLTQLLNARAFREVASRLLLLAQRYRHASVLGYVDVDNFKAVNDRLGHAEGDRVLRAVAGTLGRGVRDSDVVARLGGDEFAVFLPETDSAAAQVVFEKIRAALAREAAAHGWPIGFSIGVAVFARAPAGVEEALGFADRLMYRVKNSGKNDIVYEALP